MSEKSEPLVKHADDMAAVAEELLEAHLSTGKKATLIGACLCINHIIDWVWAAKWMFGDEERKANEYRAAFGEEHPQWKVIRDIATGLKHPLTGAPPLTTNVLEWEDDDWFVVPSGDRPVWFVMVNGKKRALAAICGNFLSTFKKLNR